MDKKPNRQEKESFRSPSEADLQVIVQIVESEHQEMMSEIDDWLQSRWLWGKDRAFVIFFKSLFNWVWKNAKVSIFHMLATDEIEKRVTNLEEIVKKIDLESIESDVAKLKKQKIPKYVQNYFNEVRGWVEEFRALREKYFPDEG